MSKLIEAAIEHFSKKELRKLEVPEWEVTVFAKNLTLEDKAKMLRRADADNTDYLIYALIYGLIDESGDAVFTIEDKVPLRRKADPDIVTRLATFVLTADNESEEEREKNL
jgi:hypothetical protein